MTYVWLVIYLSSKEEMMSIEVYANERDARKVMQDKANGVLPSVTHEWCRTWNGHICVTLRQGALYLGEMQLRPMHIIKAGE